MGDTSTRNFLVTVLVTALAMSVATTQTLAQESRYEKLANAPFPGGYPAKESVQALENELLFQQAAQSYIWSLPAVNMWAIPKQSRVLVSFTSLRPLDYGVSVFTDDVVSSNYPAFKGPATL